MRRQAARALGLAAQTSRSPRTTAPPRPRQARLTPPSVGPHRHRLGTVTCAKLSQAEALCDGGVTDLLIANEMCRRPRPPPEVHTASPPSAPPRQLSTSHPPMPLARAGTRTANAVAELDTVHTGAVSLNT